jgi:hypothetical protein
MTSNSWPSYCSFHLKNNKTLAQIKDDNGKKRMKKDEDKEKKKKERPPSFVILHTINAPMSLRIK